MNLDLRHLRALQAVAEEGSFNKAAVRLGYTQSAVSQQIQTLERIVGDKLVERPGGPRPVSMTEAGNVLLVHANAIVARLRAAQADLSLLSDGDGRHAAGGHVPERRHAHPARADAPLPPGLPAHLGRC